MGEEKQLVLWYNADFAGCGYLRSIFINDALAMKYGARKLYEGIITSRFLVDKNILRMCRVIHFQRQITAPQVYYIQMIAKFRKEDPKNFSYKIIYDLDDIFTEIPTYNFAHNYYSNLPLDEHMKVIVNTVDIFTVSTKEMAQWIKSYNGTCEVRVIPNYLPKWVYRPYEWEKKVNEKPRVVWAGSPTHFNDNDPGDFALLNDLVRNTCDEFDWVILGMKHLPPWIKDLTGKITIIPWYSINEFSTQLKKLNCDFGVAPLIDNRFNRCKSNIKLLDYFACDIIGVASNIAPYTEDAQCFLTGKWEIDAELIRSIHKDPERKNKILEAQRKISDKYWIEGNESVFYTDLFGHTERGGVKK